MVWDVSMDDYRNLCGTGFNPLLSTIAEAMQVCQTTSDLSASSSYDILVERATSTLVTPVVATVSRQLSISTVTFDKTQGLSSFTSLHNSNVVAKTNDLEQGTKTVLLQQYHLNPSTITSTLTDLIQPLQTDRLTSRFEGNAKTSIRVFDHIRSEGNDKLKRTVPSTLASVINISVTEVLRRETPLPISTSTYIYPTVEVIKTCNEGSEPFASSGCPTSLGSMWEELSGITESRKPQLQTSTSTYITRSRLHGQTSKLTTETIYSSISTFSLPNEAFGYPTRSQTLELRPNSVTNTFKFASELTPDLYTPMNTEGIIRRQITSHPPLQYTKSSVFKHQFQETIKPTRISLPNNIEKTKVTFSTAEFSSYIRTPKPTQRTTLPRTLKPTQRSTLPRTLKPTQRSTLPRTLKPIQRTTLPRTPKPTQRTTLPRTLKPTQRTTLPRTLKPTQRSTLPRTLKPIQRTTLPRTLKPTQRTTLPVSISPTTHSRINAAECNSVGYTRDPYSCLHFYRCDGNRAFRFKCPEKLEWNQDLLVCDWAHKKLCKSSRSSDVYEGGSLKHQEIFYDEATGATGHFSHYI